MEKSIFNAVESADTVLLQTIIASQPNVNIVDENFMTPLQHAAYKGNTEMVQMLLDCGADPNFCKHQHNYTALHFAGLSGNYEVCMALLVAGANAEVTNAVNRTAAQMAAFVGHHKCVTIINNYVQKSYVDYYTIAHGSETESPLPQFLSESFHKLIIQVNLHPVKIALNVHSLIGISHHLPKVKKVLLLMSEREMKRENGHNEVLAFKFFYIAFLIEELIRIEQKHTKADETKKIDTLQIFCKHVLKPGKNDTLELLDYLVKQSIKEFPFKDSTLWRQMISSLSSKQTLSAMSIINSAINGQHGFFDNGAVCSTCGEEKPTKKCSQCKTVQYCDKNCQKLHWHWHNKVCVKLSKENSSHSNNCEDAVSVDVNELSSNIKNLLLPK